MYAALTLKAKLGFAAYLSARHAPLTQLGLRLALCFVRKNLCRSARSEAQGAEASGFKDARCTVG